MKSLAQIHDETNKHRFRVRDVTTHEDHFMICAITYCQGTAQMFSGVRLEGARFGRELYNARDSKYCLLSCEAEQKYWTHLNETSAIFQAKRSYKLAKNET